jgi:hypothetical protein
MFLRGHNYINIINFCYKKMKLWMYYNASTNNPTTTTTNMGNSFSKQKFCPNAMCVDAMMTHNPSQAFTIANSCNCADCLGIAVLCRHWGHGCVKQRDALILMPDAINSATAKSAIGFFALGMLYYTLYTSRKTPDNEQVDIIRQCLLRASNAGYHRATFHLALLTVRFIKPDVCSIVDDLFKLAIAQGCPHTESYLKKVATGQKVAQDSEEEL